MADTLAAGQHTTKPRPTHIHGDDTDDAESLVSALRSVMPQILDPFPVVLAYFHGSAARGQATPWSDVDIALVIDDGVPYTAQSRLMRRVQTELDEMCQIANADVRVINEASIVFQGRIVTDGILIYARNDGERVAYESAMRQRYFDFLPIHRELQSAFFDNMKEIGLHGRPR